MIRYALNENSDMCFAHKTSKWINGTRQSFTCPDCNEPVILRKGSIKKHHFAHKPDCVCNYSTYNAGESEEHMNAKMEIAESLSKHNHVHHCWIELPLKELGVRPDILFTPKRYNNVAVAVEVQRSDISIDIIRERTEKYYRANIYGDLDIYLIWVLLGEAELGEDGYHRPKEWESYLHNFPYHRLYYWRGGCKVLPCTLHKTVNKYNPKYYTDTLLPKGCRNPEYFPGDLLDLAVNFQIKTIQQFHHFPDRKVWMDKLYKWWENDRSYVIDSLDQGFNPEQKLHGNDKRVNPYGYKG